MSIRARNISKYINGRCILNSVNIEITPGTISVLIGPSGSGKTSLIRSLSIIDKPTSGSLSIDDKNYEFPNNKIINVWPKVSVVFQQLFLWPHLTLKNNILLPLEKRVYDKEKLDYLISLFQMHEFVNRYPYQASLGQRQRVALVRALMLEPKYLLLDEITSALDYEQANTILSLLIKVHKDIGILLVTHQIEFVKKLFMDYPSNKIHFIDNGTIIESGGIEVINNPTHARIKDFFNTEII